MDTPETTVRTERWFYEYRDYLYQYAKSRIVDSHLSEDIVQQTFLAAFQRSSSFQGGSTERTWLTGILRNKIRDNLRRETREPAVNGALLDDALPQRQPAHSENCQRQVGAYNQTVNPREELERKELRNILLDCIADLPKKTREAFVLRELEAEDPKIIAQRLEVTDTGYWLLLSRARHRLRLRLRRKLDTTYPCTHPKPILRPSTP